MHNFVRSVPSTNQKVGCEIVYSLWLADGTQYLFQFPLLMYSVLSMLFDSLP